nr:odorant binding protein 26 [Pagiophloeus tsushimanus]
MFISRNMMYFPVSFQIFLYCITLMQLAASGQPKSSLLELTTQAELEECIRESKVTLKEIENISLENPPDHNMMCFLKCLLEVVEIIKDGEIDIEQAKEEWKEEITANAEKCLKAVGKISTCEDIEKIDMCLPD